MIRLFLLALKENELPSLLVDPFDVVKARILAAEGLAKITIFTSSVDIPMTVRVESLTVLGELTALKLSKKRLLAKS